MQLNSLIVAIAFLGSFFLAEGNLHAQAAPASAIVMESRGIKAELVDAPNSGGGYGEAPESDTYKGKKWLKIAFTFKAEEPIKGYIDEVKFKISLEARDFRNADDKVGNPVILTGDTTFLDVAAKAGGSKSTGYFFVHPAVLDRFGGSERNFRFFGERKLSTNNNIRIQAMVGGQLIPLDLEGKSNFVDLLADDPKWVDQCKPIENQVLAKNNSPWMAAWVDSTPLIKPLTETAVAP